MKNKKQLFLSLCCALMLSTLPVGAASCDKFEDVFGGNKEEEKFDQYAGGEFYCGGNDEAASGANTLSITDSETVTMVINGETLTGTYKFKGDTFTMTFGEKTATAKLTENGVNLTYEGVEYAFIPKVNYTVTYKIGEETKTQTVVNGRPLSKPADPAVDGFMFMGWYADSSFKTPFNFSTAIKADTTLYAKFIELDEDAQAFNVKFIVDGVEFASAKTEAGVVLNLPTPEKEGATFAGWWVSDTEDAEKLSYKYDYQIIEQDTTLFAVWESDAPLVSVNENGVTWTAKGVNNSYLVEIKNAAGEEIDSTMSTVASYDFDFSAQPAGEYIVSVTLNGKTTTVYYVNKALARVCNFVVEGTTLKFNAVAGATKYLITSECGSASHVHNEVDNGASTVYDFSACEMKAGGITFVVKALADGYVSSVSKTFSFEQNLAAPTVSVDAAKDAIVWTAVENATAYDVEINGVVVKENTTATSFDVRNYGVGALNVKVTAKAHGWNATSVEYVYNKTSLAIPGNVKITASTLTWDAVEGAAGYMVKIGDQTQMATTNAFELKDEYIADDATSCSIQIMAIGVGSATNSVYSDVVIIQLGEMADTLAYSAGKVHWDAVVNVKGYEVEFNGVTTTVDADQTNFALNFTDAGENSIRVRCIKADDSKSDWVDMSVTSYKTEFNVADGKAVDTIYAAVGDEVDLSAESVKAGYTFQGWFNTENGIDGIKYASKITQGADNLVVYAHFAANKYTVTLMTESGKEEIEVTFDRAYTLPVAEDAPEGLSFGGWYTELNGRGIAYTKENGASLKVWRDTKDVTLYANWIVALNYQEVVDETTGETAYQVVGGADVKARTEIRIPAMYNGKPVIGIGASAFESCNNLKKLEMPDTIQYIDLGVEGGTFGAGSAFKYCYSLSEFVVYKVEGTHDKFYEVIGGEGENKALVYDNPTYGKELVYVPSRLTGTYVVPEGVESIPVNCFKSSTLNKIVLPSTLTTIADYAFDEADVTEIVFANAEQPLADDGSNALTIGELAFQACYFVSEITLPARLAELPTSFADIFNRSSGLQKVNVAAPTDAGKCVYASVDGMVTNAAGNEIIFCSKYRTGDIKIDAAVKSIAANAFNGCSLIESVTVHAFVTTIGESAFEGCNGMKTLTFEATASDSAVQIARKAFYNVGISSVELPKNLGSIGEYAFGKSSALTTVVADIPASAQVAEAAFGTEPAKATDTPYFYVTALTIGKDCPKINVAGVFGGEKLMSLTVHKDNPNYILDETGILYNKVVEDDKTYPTEILFCPFSVAGDYTLPETITTIGANVFKGKGFKSVTISANVTSIGESAFASCDKLQSVVFVNADAALTDSNGLTIGDNAFDYCKQLSNIVLPKRLVAIGEGAFDSCAMAGEFVIPENVTTIGNSAFYNCTKITSIKLPKALEVLGKASTAAAGMLVFDGCTALASISLDESNTAFKVIDGVLYKLNADGVPTELMYCPVLNTGKQVDGKNVIEVPSTVTTVWTNAFKNVSTIDEVKFVAAEGVALTVNKNAFAGANIGSVILPEGMETIKSDTFTGAGIKSITIPGSVTSIEKTAFKNCTVLETVIFAEGTKALVLGATSGNGPFYGCSSLKNIVLPERTTQIGYQTFYGCSSLESIVIPSQIKQIYGQTFYNATSLKSVTFTKNAEGKTVVTKLDAAAFRNTALETFEIPESVTTLGGSAFADTKLKSIHVPASITTLGSMVKGITTLESITFAENCKITAIANNEFSGCTSLKSIVIPATVKTIGFTSFKDCTSLESITFATKADGTTSLTKIDHDAFANCKSLTEFILPATSNAKLELNYNLFTGCRNIQKVSLPAQVTSLARVFDGCAPIKEIKVDENNQNLVIEDGIVYNKAKTRIDLVMKDLATENLVIPDTIEEIGAYAFANQASLKSVSLPAGIKVIGVNAFENCYNLQSVTFRESDGVADQLTKISDYTFYGCKSLTNITIPETVTEIGSYAFACCPLSEDFVIPENVTSFGTYAFLSSGIRSANISAAVTTLSNYMFQDCQLLESVTIAEGSKLTTIGNTTFKGCTALKNFVMPDTVTKIDYYAFSESGIETITMSKNLTTLSATAFMDAKALKSIEIFEGITKLDYQTFKGCSSLVEVKLPASLKQISYEAFMDCTSLEEIELPANLTALDQASSWSTSRKSFAFAGCTSLKKVVLNNVTKLGHDAFSGCTSLVDIDLSKVTDMNNNVFLGCTALKSVDLSALKTPQANIFDGCYNLEEVKFGGQLASIGNYMFANCTKLANVEIPDSVKTVGNAAFQNCRALTEITLPKQVTKISNNVFDGCTNLENVQIAGAITSIGEYAFNGCAKINAFALPSTLTTALGDRFLAGTSVKKIVIPSSYAKIWTSGLAAPFAGCETLEAIEVDNGNSVFKSVDGVLYDLDGFVRAIPAVKKFENDTFIVKENENVGYMAFAGLKNIKKIVLPDSMTEIPQNAFRDCYGLEEVVLGANVVKINSWAFQDCPNLKKGAKADGTWEGIENIASQAFMGCSSLTSVVLPSTLTTVSSTIFSDSSMANGDGFIFESGLKEVTIPANLTAFSTMFQKATGLEKVIISEGITEIPANAFLNCPNLKEVVLPSTLTSIGASAFSGTALASIVIPDSVTTIGSKAFENCAALTSVKLPAGLVELTSSVFSGCSALTAITIPETVTTIGTSAFANSGLTSVVLPNSVTSLGGSAFNGCVALESVTLPAGLTVIGSKTFMGCSALKSIVLPDTLTSIGDNVFNGCTALEGLVIPESVTSIGANAFDGCTKIASIVIPEKAWVGANVFNGWTAEQTINVVVDEFVAASLWTGISWSSTSGWTLDWSGGSLAKFVFNYTPTV